MNRLLHLSPDALFALLFYQTFLQQRVIELQQQIIDLQQRIDKMTPANPPDEEVFWHLASDGISSSDAANASDVATLRRFRKWNVDFAKKHIKPYVNPKVYGECVNQMTRGLSERIAELETEREKVESTPPTQKTSGRKTTLALETPKQLALLQ